MGITAYIRRQFKNGVSVTDTVPAGFSNSATSFTAADGTTFPDGSVGPFIITADQGLTTEEKILIQSRSGATFTVASGGRGYNGTTASTHAAGASILHTIDAQDMDEANQTMAQTIGAIQAKGDLLVGSAANTLTRLAIGTTAQTLQVVSGTLSYIGFGSGQSQSVGSSNTDGSQTTYARSDHIHALPASAVEALFTADQQIFSGTGNGTGEIIDLMTALREYFASTGQINVGTGSGTGKLLSAGSAGTVLTVGGADASGLEWIYPALSTASGTLGSPYTVTGSYVTFLTTASLAAGTWLVNFSGTCQVPPGGGFDFKIALGTATATFAGPVAGTCDTMSATGSGGWDSPSMALTTIVTVTVAGTLVFQAGGAASPASTIDNNSLNLGTAGGTGYTAVRIA